jgi:gliding motility-associated-like protein
VFLKSPLQYIIAFVIVVGVAFPQTAWPQSAEPILPNIFTPNEDAINDEFRILANGLTVNSFSLKIYNRFGVLLFSTNNINISWDGRTNAGLKVPEGIYFYIAEINGKKYNNSLMVVY